MRKIKFSALLALLVIAVIFCTAFAVSAEPLQNPMIVMNEDYIYRTNQNKTVTIEMFIGNKTDVTVPSMIDGLPVKEIGAYAFCNSGIETLTVSEGIETVGLDAFYNCQSLTSVTLPKSLRSIAPGMFRYCTNLSKVNFHNETEVLGEYMFYGCRSLKSVRIPPSVIYVPRGAFAYCENLYVVYFYDGLRQIGDGAFMYCSIISLSYPKNLFYIGHKAFAYNKDFDTSGAPWDVNIENDAFVGCNGIVLGYPGDASGQEVTQTVCTAAETFCTDAAETLGAPPDESDPGAVSLPTESASAILPPEDSTDPHESTDSIDKTTAPCASLPASESITSEKNYHNGDISELAEFEDKKIKEMSSINENRKEYLMSVAWDVRLRGDANGDGTVNIKDATQIQKYAAGLIRSDSRDFVFKSADVDANGTVNIKDATAVQKIVAGLFPY